MARPLPLLPLPIIHWILLSAGVATAELPGSDKLIHYARCKRV